MFCWSVVCLVGPKFFFFNDTATTEIYPLSLHDALPIYPVTGELLESSPLGKLERQLVEPLGQSLAPAEGEILEDRKSTRLNSSHANISYAVFCLKKNKIADEAGVTRELPVHNEHRREVY